MLIAFHKKENNRVLLLVFCPFHFSWNFFRFKLFQNLLRFIYLESFPTNRINKKAPIVKIPVASDFQQSSVIGKSATEVRYEIRSVSKSKGRTTESKHQAAKRKCGTSKSEHQVAEPRQVKSISRRTTPPSQSVKSQNENLVPPSQKIKSSNQNVEPQLESISLLYPQSSQIKEIGWSLEDRRSQLIDTKYTGTRPTHFSRLNIIGGLEEFW